MTTTNDTTTGANVRFTAVLDRTFRIAAMAADEDHRYGINRVLLRGGRAVATDGRGLASVPLEGAKGIGDGVLVDRKAMAVAAKRTPSVKREPVARIDADGVTVGATRTAFGEPVERTDDPRSPRFPEYVQCVPADVGDRIVVALNVKLLAKMADALGACDGSDADGCVFLELDATDTTMPIGVRPIHASAKPVADGGPWGLLMPLAPERKGEEHRRAVQVVRGNVEAGASR